MKPLLIAINSKYIHPGYGIYQIVANADQKPQYQEFNIKDDINEIIRFILNTEANLLGFSCYIWNIEMIKAILKKLEEHNYNTPILLGGPEVSYQCDYFFNNFNINYIIKNEGEIAYNELIQYLNHQLPLNKVSNLYYIDDNRQIKYTYNKLPKLDLIKPAHYLVDDIENKIVYFESSRGCCFNCSYCMASLEDNIRLFPIEMVKKEIKKLLKIKVKTIKFLDRSFNIYINHALEIIKCFIENDNYYTTVQFEVVGDVLDNKIIEYIINYARPGYFRFEIGIQSTNPITTKAVRRKQNFKKLSENINKLRGKVTLHLDLIAGLPYEDKNSFINTFNETFLLFGDELQLGFLKELKGTLISEEQHLHSYVFEKTAPYEVIENNYITKNELDEIRKVEQITNRFYNNGLFKNTFIYLTTEENQSPYHLFLGIYEYFEKINFKLQNYQIHELFVYTFDYLKTISNLNHNKILFIMKTDYLSHFKVRPKIWWETKDSSNDKHHIFSKLIEIDNQLTLDTLYRYCRVEKYNNDAFAILYLPNGTTTYNFKI